MTKLQRKFLTFVRDYYFNQSQWLTSEGKPPTSGMQRLAFLEVSCSNGTIRIDADELLPIKKFIERGTVTQSAWTLTDKGKKLLEDAP
jgi:hypothetical protein